MTPNRIEVPEPTVSTSVGRDESARKARSLRAVMFVAGGILLITALHFIHEPASANDSLHFLYRRLYIIPIVYAAWVFGKRGGLSAAVAVSIPLLIHERLAHGHAAFAVDTDMWLEVVSYVVLGLLFGTLRDIEETRAEDLRQVSSALSDAYKKLEDRAIQLITVQDYTQSILRSITSGVFTVGQDGSLATANPAAERMLGMSEYEMVPKPISRVFRDDDGLSLDVAKVLSGRVPFALREAKLVTRDGREVNVQTSTSRMRAVGGSVLGAVVTLEDVSDIRALTDQLIRADRLAAMGELTAGVAHEVRNPLGVIRASVQLLEEAQCDPARIHEASTVIKQEIDRLDRVIKALLDFGRPSRPTMLRSDLRVVLEDVVLFTRRFATQSNVTITLDAGDSELPVMGDPDQLKQVFLNLVTNAVQAMGDTGGEITISTSLGDDYLTVSVADDGPGIAEGEIGKLFDPFYTLRAEGTGLGLTIVHRIIDEHDGHIEVDSKLGEGACFTVTLPVCYEEQG